MQTDIQLLTVTCAENYAKQNNLTEEEVFIKFSQNQIFEKIIIQHEYLHQISIDEVMEFIYKELNKKTKELIVFHGTVEDFKSIDLEKSHKNRDFGKGFYTTLLENQAKDWAFRLSLRNSVDKYFVKKFVFTEDSSLKIKRFNSLNEEWLEFIKSNRSDGNFIHDYDVVIGPVADDNTMETVQLYIAGTFTIQEAVNRLSFNKVNNQISFHTKKALNFIKYLEQAEYE